MFLKTVFNSLTLSLPLIALAAGPAMGQPEAPDAPEAPEAPDAADAPADAPDAPADAPADDGPEIDVPDVTSSATPHAEAAGHASGGSATMVGGYGELHFNRVMPEEGDAESEIDFHRMVVYLGKTFTSELRFYSELEIEHGIAGDGKPGEVALEQAFVEYQLADENSALGEFGVRAGIVLVPMGIINQWHEPPVFHGVERPGVDKRVIPSTWREGGAGVYGKLGAVPELRYELYVVGGLDPLGFDAGSGIRGGRQKVGEARADGLAITGRAEYHLGTSTVLGGAGYFGMAGPNAGDVFDAAGNPVELDVPVAGFAVDARTKRSGVEARAVLAMFSIGDTEELAGLTDADGNAIGPAVGDSIFGVYGEVAYDVLYTKPTTQQLLPFARFEYSKTHPDIDESAITDLVFGLSYRPIPQVAFKGDVILRRPGGDTDGDNATILDLGVGFLY